MGTMQTIVSAAVPYYLRNTWFLTLGSQYQVMPKWVLRMAAGYNQTPGNGSYQIANGNSYILGVSTGYAITKAVTIDGGYAHAFIQTANININSRAVLVDGLTDGARDSVSLKMTLNL